MDEISTMPQDEANRQNLTGVGARLKAAREASHLTEKDVAVRLYLNIEIIYKMEQERFNDVPTTFMRGYLRSYARLVHLNEAELLPALNQLNLVSPISSVRSQPAAKQHNNHHHLLDRYLRWSSYGIISILFVLVIVWWSSHPRFNEIDTASKQVAQIPAVAPVETVTSSPTPPINMQTSQTTVSIPPLLARHKTANTAHKESTEDNAVKTAETHTKPKITHHLDIIDEEDNEKYIDQNNIY
jgi:cytoskeleton protein RodZ